MIPLELRIAELEEYLGKVAAWLEHRMPELAPVGIHCILQDEGAMLWEIADFLVEAGDVEVEKGLAFEEARRCLASYGWHVCCYHKSVISACAFSYAVRLSSFDWLETLARLEDGDPIFGPE